MRCCLRTVLRRLKSSCSDQERWKQDAGRDHNSYFIDESIAHYLKRISAGPVLVEHVVVILLERVWPRA